MLITNILGSIFLPILSKLDTITVNSISMDVATLMGNAGDVHQDVVKVLRYFAILLINSLFIMKLVQFVQKQT